LTDVIQVTTHPFGASGRRPREVLDTSGWSVRYNPYQRRLKTPEVAELVRDAVAIVAGTEPYTADVIDACPHLRVIARVGVGLDSVDLTAARERGLAVTYTPEAPADAVAELTVAQILNILRRTQESDRSVRERAWNRYMGQLVREVAIGVLGVGRIGKRVVRLLRPFSPHLLACDTSPDLEFGQRHELTWVNRRELFERCDLVTVHVPLTSETHHLVDADLLSAVRPGFMLVNTSRGKVLDEAALVEALREKRIARAALDVFEDEPYEGPLARMDNVALTAHMGASAHHSRYLMELGAAEDCVRVLNGEAPRHSAFDDATGVFETGDRSASARQADPASKGER
jgi:D-3-phosphoglycerate dehydrogenase